MIRTLSLTLALLTVISAAARPLSEEKRLRRVELKRNGEVIINYIPSIKAQRDYCVPASVEMVLRYYGARIKQKKLGRLFNSSHKGGTSHEALLNGFNDKELREYECRKLYAITNQEVHELVTLHNNHPALSRAAKKKIQSGIKHNQYIFDLLDPEIAKKVSPQARKEFTEKFTQILKEYVAKGFPLLWSVAMNLDPYDRTTGGHMRVICGYKEVNNQITEVIYLDPWGNKRKFKRATRDETVMMTKGLMVILPK